MDSLEYLCSNTLLSQYPEIAWAILEDASFNYSMGDVIRTEVLKVQQKNYKLALDRFLILSCSLKNLSEIFKENVSLLKYFVITTQQLNKTYTSLMDMGEEGDEVKKLTTELGNTATQYNQNVEKLWDILISFQPNAKKPWANMTALSHWIKHLNSIKRVAKQIVTLHFLMSVLPQYTNSRI